MSLGDASASHLSEAVAGRTPREPAHPAWRRLTAAARWPAAAVRPGRRRQLSSVMSWLKKVANLAAWLSTSATYFSSPVRSSAVKLFIMNEA